MSVTSLLIANRGEIAIRIIRAATELGIRTVSIYSEDDARSLHTRRADSAIALRGSGVAAYLDIEQIVALAREAGCDAVHPGYGFLSENAAFARRCIESGLTFVGPTPETLELFGDKGQARALAAHLGVPVLPGTSGPTSLDEAHAFVESLGPGGAVMVKAVSGGGGRGMRLVERRDDLDSAYKRCQSEAKSAFGNGDVYVEQLIRRARHIEIQVIGDGSGEVSHLWERECSIQRRNQKIVEIAPSPTLPTAIRDQLTGAALRLASEVGYRSLGTFEFLVDASEGGSGFAFIEANPRLQVEHTVTEEVTGVDLVRAQLQIAGGATLAELGLLQRDIPPPRGFAIQTRITMESMAADGSIRPAGGTLTAFELPTVAASAPIRSPTPATPPARTSIRCSPSSSSTRRPTITRPPAPLPTARSLNSASKALAPTSLSYRRCFSTRTLSPTTSTRASSKTTPPNWWPKAATRAASSTTISRNQPDLPRRVWRA